MHAVSFSARALLAALLVLAPVSVRAQPAPVDVAIVTTMGTIVVELDLAHAPVTAGNFLKHVDAGVYNHAASFYRTVHSPDPAHPARIEIIQGGIEPADDKMPPIPVEKTTETGLHNVAGTIAMARTADPKSATSEFYINTGDDRVLDADEFSDGFGYAVFGRIVKGSDVIAKIQTSPASGQNLTPPIKILRIKRA
jgi:peptidyl-prolyl cis-trans isomerase A (cyclophilin A)